MPESMDDVSYQMLFVTFVARAGAASHSEAESVVRALKLVRGEILASAQRLQVCGLPMEATFLTAEAQRYSAMIELWNVNLRPCLPVREPPAAGVPPLNQGDKP